MFIILKKVRTQQQEYGFVIARRNLSQGRNYHLPTTDSKTLSTYIYQHGYVASPIKELDDIIALGMKLWMEIPENIVDELENIIIDILTSFSMRFSQTMITNSGFRPFQHLYFNYNQKDGFVESVLNQGMWSHIIDRYNLMMRERDFISNSVNLEISEEESEYLRILVVRLMTRGIRYGVMVYKGNVNLANTLFDLTKDLLQPYMNTDVYNELFILVDKRNKNVTVNLNIPKRFVRFNELFINENNYYKE